MNATKHMIFAALMLAASVAQAQVPLARTLERVVVTHCYMQNPVPPVVIVEHPEVFTGSFGGVASETEVIPADIEVDAEPPTPDVGCRTVDSYVHAVNFSGSLLTWGVDGAPIEQVMYTISVTDGENIYRLADWATSLDWAPNGARYTVGSNLLLDGNGAPLEYDISFLRRAPSLREIQVDGRKVMVDNYDAVTILRFERITEDGFISVTADFRD